MAYKIIFYTTVAPKEKTDLERLLQKGIVLMRIAFVSQSIAGGGAERVTVNLANRLVTLENMKVFLITGKATENDYVCDNRVHCIRALKVNLVQDILTLRKLVFQHEIDIVVGMGIFSNFCVCLANWEIPAKMVISERNAPAYDKISKKSKLLRFLTYRLADAYVFQTAGAKAFYSKAIQRRGVIIPNPIKPGLPMRTNEHRKEIVAAGRLSVQKNFAMLLDAFAIICQEKPEYILRIFGQGPCEHALRQQSENLGIADRVVFEGFCDHVHEKIKDSDIFVLSSDFEGIPNALMEAMAMGFPSVSTDCPSGGPQMLIQHKENGLLVPVNDAKKMAEEILWLIDHPEQKERLASAAKETYAKYSIDEITQKWISFFDSIL